MVNDLIRKAREIEAIRARLIHAESSLFTSQGRAEILAEAKADSKIDPASDEMQRVLNMVTPILARILKNPIRKNTPKPERFLPVS